MPVAELVEPAALAWALVVLAVQAALVVLVLLVVLAVQPARAGLVMLDPAPELPMSTGM